MKPVPRKAFQEISGLKTKHAIRQTTDGLWQLTLTVHEFGTADWLVFAPTGLPLAIGLKAMDYDNPEEPSQQKTLIKDTYRGRQCFAKMNAFRYSCRSFLVKRVSMIGVWKMH